MRLLLVMMGLLLLFLALPMALFWRALAVFAHRGTRREASASMTCLVLACRVRERCEVYVESAGGRKRVIIRTQRAHWLSSWGFLRPNRPARSRSPRVANLDRIDTQKSDATEKSLTLEPLGGLYYRHL